MPAAKENRVHLGNEDLLDHLDHKVHKESLVYLASLDLLV
jgi:hypothetical protein